MNDKVVKMFEETINESNEYIWVKPVCDFFEINYENQTRIFKKDRILANHSTKKSNSLLFLDNYPRILVSKLGFIRWIQILNPKIIKIDLREKFEIYQEEITKYIFGEFSKKEQIKTDYTRLKKLKRLYSIIGLEIQRLQKGINNYMDTTYIQTSLPFESQKILK